jgi:RND family efflux transporter MFP subunit
MSHKYLLPLAACVFLAFAVAHALYIQRPDPASSPPAPPPQSPFGDTVAGEGQVEPFTEASTTGTIAIGSQLAGVVTKVWVTMGQEVKSGDLLFELDPRATEADLKVREANIPVMEAQVGVAEANSRSTKDTYERYERALPTRAVSENDYMLAKQAYLAAAAQLILARANVAMARAQVEQDKVQLELMKVRAPVNGAVLQVNIRAGEYVTTLGSQSLILMGNLQRYQVRVNVDEEDIPRLKLSAPARAKIRGDVFQEEIPMTFVRLEPYVVPKTSLTGMNTERVDTRVAQVIYTIDASHHLVKEKRVLMGQLLDVFIDVREGSSNPGGPE